MNEDQMLEHKRAANIGYAYELGPDGFSIFNDIVTELKATADKGALHKRALICAIGFAAASLELSPIEFKMDIGK